MSREISNQSIKRKQDDLSVVHSHLLPRDIEPVFLTEQEAEDAKKATVVYASNDSRNIRWNEEQNQV